MKELQLRKLHRGTGIVLAVFLFLQAGTGILLSLEGLPISGGRAHTDHEVEYAAESEGQAHWDPVGTIHHGGGRLGALYRLALGASTLWMALSGLWIYWKIRIRWAGRRQQGHRAGRS